MKSQVLSIKQMQELVNLGIDTFKASMCWIGYADGNDVYPYNSTFKDIFESHKETIPSVLTPTFTLQDILEMLPDIIVNHEVYIPVIQKNFCKYVHNDNPILHLEVANNTIEAAFNMLKWCKQNNYI